MNIAIIDDELHNRMVLRRILENNCPQLRITVDEGSIETSIEALNRQKPELVFLDIRLRNGTGFDIVEKLNYKPKIIFTTAYSEYVLKAFKVQALDYLLKPIDEAELIKAVAKAERSSASRSGSNNLIYHYKSDGEQRSISFDDILYFETEGSQSWIVTESHRLTIASSMEQIEKELPESRFYRTHKDYIINLKKIKSIDVRRESRVNLANDSSIPVASQNLSSLLNIIKLTNVS